MFTPAHVIPKIIIIISMIYGTLSSTGPRVPSHCAMIMVSAIGPGLISKNSNIPFYMQLQYPKDHQKRANTVKTILGTHGGLIFQLLWRGAGRVYRSIRDVSTRVYAEEGVYWRDGLLILGGGT